MKKINKIHTTQLSAERIKRNLDLDVADIVDWCKTKIGQADEIIRNGKNWYVYVDNIVMTINAHSYTIITAHRIKDKKRESNMEVGGKADMNVKSDLIKIPGIGKKMAEHLVNIGYPDIKSLKGQNPEEIYTKHCLLYGPGNQSCKCVLYCYRLAVHYADHNGELPPDKQNWGDWKKPL